MTQGTKIGIVSGALVLLLGAGIAWMLSGHEKYPEGLGREDFGRCWAVESESPDYRIVFLDEGIEITAPKGLTLWYGRPVEAPCVIEYEARVMLEREGDRLSDLNCFWMASDPEAEDVFVRSAQRGGKFSECASLQLYYVGYGGNYNSTTRFRRYDGKPDPALLQEYTDQDHLLRASHWYRIRLVCRDGRAEYWIDGEKLFEYEDPDPLVRGWFGFRTTLSRTQFRKFRITRSSYQF